jgi:hypothetical protein
VVKAPFACCLLEACSSHACVLFAEVYVFFASSASAMSHIMPRTSAGSRTEENYVKWLATQSNALKATKHDIDDCLRKKISVPINLHAFLLVQWQTHPRHVHKTQCWCALLNKIKNKYFFTAVSKF